MVRSFLASIRPINPSSAILLNMRVEGMRESEMVPLEQPENQDKRLPPLNQRLHEVRNSSRHIFRANNIFGINLIDNLGKDPEKNCHCEL